MVHSRTVIDEAGASGASSDDLNSGSPCTALEAELSDLNATSSATTSSSPKSPSMTLAVLNPEAKERRQQAAGDSTIEEPTQAAADDDLQLTLHALRAEDTTPKRSASASTPIPAPPPHTSSTAKVLASGLNCLIEYTILTIGDVLKGVLNALTFVFVLLQKPLTVMMVVYALLLISTQMLSTVETALSPICHSRIMFKLIPICGHFDAPKTATAPMADYNKLLNLQYGMKDVVELAGDYSLSERLSRAKVAITDLTTQVQVSDLPSKGLLAAKLEEFAMEADDATEGLLHLSSRVGGSLEAILSTDNFAIERLEKINGGAISTGSMLANMVMLRPFDHVKRREREELASTFEEISEVMAEELLQMVNEAKVVLRLLNRLDTAQNALHDMILKEKKIVKRDRDELSQLWTLLGQKRRELAMFAEHVDLLEQMSDSRSIVQDRIRKTILQLKQMSADLSDLRKRVGRPFFLGGFGVVPLEVHLESLRRGAQNLYGFRVQARERENKQLRGSLAVPLPKSHRIDSK